MPLMHRFPCSSGMLPPPNNNKPLEPASPPVGLSPASPQQYTMASAADQRTLLEPIHLSADALYASLHVFWSFAVSNHSISSKFFLDIAQQPVRSRMSGVGEKSMFLARNCMLTFVLDNRRPIGISAILSCGSFTDVYVDPPPAVKLRVIGPDGMELQLYVPCSLTFVDTRKLSNRDHEPFLDSYSYRPPW